MRLDVLTPVTMNITDFWGSTMCCLIYIYTDVSEEHTTLIFRREDEDGGSIFVQDIGKHLPDYSLWRHIPEYSVPQEIYLSLAFLKVNGWWQF
jgi:hypothetical protein